MEERSTTDSSPPQRMLSSPADGVSRLDLTHVFARGQDEKHDGLSPGFFEGPKHQRLVRGRSPRHRGVHVGRVVSSNRGALVVKMDDQLMEQTNDPLKRGDGIVVDRGVSCCNPISTARIGEVSPLVLSFIDAPGARVGGPNL